MSWRDRLQQASFRGVPFFVEGATGSGGRNVAIHEFPLQEFVVVEDLGKKAGAQQLPAYVLGPDYDLLRDELQDALDQPGIGTLVHPYKGTLSIQITEWSWSIFTTRGGYCQFTIQYVTEDAGLRIGAVSANTATLLDNALAASAGEVNGDLEKGLDSSGPAHIAAQVKSQLGNAISALRSINGQIAAAMQPLADLANDIDTLGNELSTLIRQPLALAQQLEGVISSTLGAFSDVQQAFKAYENMMVLFGSERPISTTSANGTETANRLKMAANQQAISRVLLTHGTLAMAAQMTKADPFTSYNDAVMIRDAPAAEPRCAAIRSRHDLQHLYQPGRGAVGHCAAGK
jgi:prophage DNA circulation protein